jgi:leucyl aminopeptidase
MPKVAFRRAPPDGPHPVAVPVAEGTPPPSRFAAAAQAARFTGRAGQALLLHAPLPALLVGAGAGASPADWMRAGGTAAAHLPKGEAEGAAHLVLDARGRSAAEAAAMAAGALLRDWRFTRHRTRDVQPGLAQVTLLADDPAAARAAWEREAAAVQGCLLARDLVSEPANHLSTRHFAARLEALAAHGIAVDIWGRRRLERAGLGGLLAVGRAAEGRRGSPSSAGVGPSTRRQSCWSARAWCSTPAGSRSRAPRACMRCARTWPAPPPARAPCSPSPCGAPRRP